MSTPDPAQLPGYHEPTGNATPEPNYNLKAIPIKTSPPPATHDATGQSSSSGSSSLPVMPRATAGGGGGSYEIEHLPNQVRPGPRAPEPVSHVPIQAPSTIEETLDLCEALWEVARFPRIDASWPRLRARLREHERDPSTDASVLYRVRWYLYHVRPTLPADETEERS